MDVAGHQEVLRGAELRYQVEVDRSYKRRQVSPPGAAASAAWQVRLETTLDAGEDRVPIAIRALAVAPIRNSSATLTIDRIDVTLVPLDAERQPASPSSTPAWRRQWTRF